MGEQEGRQLTFPAYDPSEPPRVKRLGHYVNLWRYPNGESWRNPELAQRAVEAWRHEQGEKLRT